MYYLKNKYFHRWAKKQGITDKILFDAIEEFAQGLFEANLGNHLYKKRIPLAGKGKSGGARTILFYQQGRKLIFCFGFEKNEQANLTHYQNKVINQLSDIFQNLTEDQIKRNIKIKEFLNISRTEG